MLKKTLAVALIYFILFSLTACAPKAEPAAAQPNAWGITLQAESVTAKGLTLVCTQSGGENIVELSTGSFFVIQKHDGGTWSDVPYLAEGDVQWTMEGWLIPLNDSLSWDISYEWLYGELPAGDYRIGKEIMNFRGPGDYDEERFYAEFSVK